MKYPIFASVVVFCLWLMFDLHRLRNKEAKKYQNFIDRENEANSTRRKSLDDLQYITIPFNELPMDTLNDDPKVNEYHQTLRDLSANPIVNLTGFTNTDLKLQYGAPNIDLLTNYDQAYTLLARTLASWGQVLFDNGYYNEAKSVLKYAVSTKTDVSSTYVLLSKIYKSEGNEDEIRNLIEEASSLKSLSRNTIVRKLEALLYN